MHSHSLKEHYLQRSVSDATFPGEMLKVFEQYCDMIRAVLLKYDSRRWFEPGDREIQLCSYEEVRA